MWLEILLQFLTVFLGAFLAFWLENLRERRQLKTWVKKYLQRGYETMRQEQLQEEAEIPKLEQQLHTLEKFSSSELHIGEEDWRDLAHVYYNFQKESISLLDGEALRVLDAELIKTVQTVETLNFACAKVSELYTNAYKDYVIPLVLRQPTLPTKAEQQGIEYVRAVASQLVTYRQQRLGATKKLLQMLEQHNYHN
jgi:hypothetical protein